MYLSRFDPDQQVFYVTLVGPVQLTELARSLRDCFAVPYVGEMRAFWEISKMQVEFGIQEVDELLQVVQAADVPRGKFAFVVSDQEFLRSVVQSVRGLRDEWTTSWRIFASAEDAAHWLTE